jgi:UPF0755 protein
MNPGLFIRTTLKKFKDLYLFAVSLIRGITDSGTFRKLILPLKSFLEKVKTLAAPVLKKITVFISGLYKKIERSKVLSKVKSYLRTSYNFLKTKTFPVITSFLKKVYIFLHAFFEKFGKFALRKPYIFVPALAFVYLIIFLSLIYYSLFSKYYWGGDLEKKYSLKQGKNLTEITADLKEQDIIRNGFIFKMIVKISGNEENIISRNYVFKNGMSNLELLSVLTDKTESVKFRIPEGQTIKQIAKLVESKLMLSSEKFIKATRNDTLIESLGLKGKVKNLEGFLFPDTYQLPAAIDEVMLVEILVKEFKRKISGSPEIMDKMKENNMDLLSAVTLGSIIEAETALKPELLIISGVYHNRLNKNMKLEADPTVNYALPDGPKQRLLFKDLKIDSPYNTYKYTGLPPGPINNPGYAAILAAVNPEKNNYLYFVATGEGGHKFSVTYEEHQKAIKEYRKKQK